MEQLAGDAGRLAGCGPGLSEVPHRLDVTVEDEVTDQDLAVLLELPALPSTVNQVGQVTFQHDRAASPRLGGFGR